MAKSAFIWLYLLYGRHHIVPAKLSEGLPLLCVFTGQKQSSL